MHNPAPTHSVLDSARISIHSGRMLSHLWWESPWSVCCVGPALGLSCDWTLCIPDGLLNSPRDDNSHSNDQEAPVSALPADDKGSVIHVVHTKSLHESSRMVLYRGAMIQLILIFARNGTISKGCFCQD